MTFDAWERASKISFGGFLAFSEEYFLTKISRALYFYH